ncbi:MAG: transaldolase family protein [Planctomycetes bacterium]|nr:transaldolase family protein [Planctomycetota bacterium]
MSAEETPLQQTARLGRTDFWNDSCSVRELEYAIRNGAVGATTNPAIVLAVLKAEMALWRSFLENLPREYPEAGEDDLAWKLIEAMAVKGAEMLLPIHQREKGRKGFLSIQTNAKYYRNASRIVEQAVHFSRLAANIQVKIPATASGIQAIAEATYRGVGINATVSFTVPQALAVAEAVEQGLKRREAEGLPVDGLRSVCTIMVGRTDDWIKQAVAAAGTLIDPECLEWAGVAVAKRAYRLYRERGYRTRLLFGALRNHYHWSEFLGGDVVLTIPHLWQKRINAGDIPVTNRMDKPVNQAYVDTLLDHVPDFRKAYLDDGMTVDDFDNYGATRVTLRSFLESYDNLVAIVRDFVTARPGA